MSDRNRIKIRFKRSVSEQRRAVLRAEVDSYWESMGTSPDRILEDVMEGWVSAGNSPYTNPYGDTDWRTGRTLDFWESRLARGQTDALNHIQELEAFGRKESLEEILKFTLQAIEAVDGGGGGRASGGCLPSSGAWSELYFMPPRQYGSPRL